MLRKSNSRSARASQPPSCERGRCAQAVAVSPASIIDEPADAVIPADSDTEAGAVGQTSPSTEDDEGPASFTAIDIDRLLGSFGAEAGAEGFNSQFDFDNDGVINFGDLNTLLTNLAQNRSAND